MRASSHVLGIGVFLPDTIRTNDAWPDDFAPRGRAEGDRTLVEIPGSDDLAGRVSAEHLAQEACDPFLGSCQRRVADAATSSADAELAAARDALADAELSAREIDVVLSWATVPDRVSPSAAPYVAEHLGARKAVAFGIDAACASALCQLTLARALVSSGQAKHVLLTQSHLLTRAFPLAHPASPGIGDAASALVVSRTPRWPIVATHAVTHGDYYDAVTWCRGREPSSDVPWWKAGGDFHVGSRRVEAARQLMRDTVAYGAGTVRELLLDVGLDIERVSLLAAVQPRGWIPGAIARCLGLPEQRVECTYRAYAHLGGCGPIVNWWSARRRGGLAGGGLIALYAQGGGFTRAAALIEM